MMLFSVKGSNSAEVSAEPIPPCMCSRHADP